jgi:1-acyl-sn-glycerol-3-phosphate acyltransferase
VKARLSALVFGVSMLATRVVVWTFARWTVHDAGKVPAEGGVILIGNHLHLLDPPLVMASTRRRTRPMAKRDLFETPLVGWWFWAFGAFPVRRYSADIGALRAARNLIRQGEAVLMFPEGTRSKDGAGLQPALPGAAMVALLAGAPIIPVAITGTENIRIPGVFFRPFRRDRIHLDVRFGEPFRLPAEMTDARHAEEASDFMMRRVAELLPESYRGAYGPGSEDRVVFARSEVRLTAPRRSTHE